MSDTNTTPAVETPTAVDKDIFYKTLYGAAHDEAPPETVPEVKPAPTPTPTPAPEPVVKKKATVREADPTPAPAPVVDNRQQVAQLVEQELARRTPAPIVPEPTPQPVLTGATPEETEEIELARYAETLDPTKKGLAEQVAKFHVANKEFIERALEADPDFDPTSDPSYKKFLAKAEPKFSAADKRMALIKRETSAAELRAAERVRQELAPAIEANRAQLREITVRPDITKKVTALSSEIFTGTEDEAFKAFAEKGEAASEDFPIETEILHAEKTRTVRLAEEFLAIRNGLKPFSAAENAEHREISEFVTNQGNAFLKHGGKHLVREGKTFVHPSQWKADMAATHWTFSNEDVVNALQVEASRRAKSRIKIEHDKIEKAVAARTRRAAPAPSGATEQPSPRAAAAAPAPAKVQTDKDITARILGYV